VVFLANYKYTLRLENTFRLGPFFIDFTNITLEPSKSCYFLSSIRPALIFPVTILPKLTWEKYSLSFMKNRLFKFKCIKGPNLFIRACSEKKRAYEGHLFSCNPTVEKLVPLNILLEKRRDCCNCWQNEGVFW